MSSAPDQNDAGPRPWEAPDQLRRDWLPHRSKFLIGLADVALACATFGLFLCAPAPVGLALGAVAWALARRDVGLMDAGLMDPAGREKAEEAGRLALVCVLLGLIPSLVLCWLGWSCLLHSIDLLPPPAVV
jgi:hypothetical protein